MKFKQFVRAFAPIVGIALAAAVAGCDGATIKLNDEEGKKLSDLDLSGAPPEELVMAGPDEVQVTQGDKLAITVNGDPDAAAKMRFTLKDGTLGILREGKLFDRDGGKVAVVHVTMPAPKGVVMAGSGKIVSATLARTAKVTVAGSGLVETTTLDGDSLELNIAGSGSYRGSGKVTALDLTVAGSGAAALDALRVDTAKVSIAGSGGVAFTSDGEVDATIMGSGEVKVKGRARCKVSSMGSGRLVCETPVENADPDDGDATAEPSNTPG
ncbi:MAG: head GIN domain-containing protein [Novosphingobium sp.]|uniref:head GIN domain-containing protein n=1 Tax=Novosphingobium sp. TaxID=1874826 RepID=UPI0032B7E07B